MNGREIYPDEELRRRIMDFIMAAGQTLLENGAEVFRVEQTMEIMARSFHLREFHVYVLTNGIFASAGTAEISEVRNVPTRTTHLGRVAAVNALSREIAEGNMTLDEAESRLVLARRIPFPKDWGQLVSGLCAHLRRHAAQRAGGGGGGPGRQLVSAAVRAARAAGRLPQDQLCGPHHAGVHPGLQSAGHARQPRHHRRADDPDPGHRLHHGHPGLRARRLSFRHHPHDRRAAHCSQHRHRHRPCAEPLYILYGGGGRMMLTSTQIGELAAQFFIAGAGTLSFAILFGCPRKSLPFCGLVGAVGWFVYELAVLLGMDAAAASLLAVIPLTLLTRVFAIVLKMPVTVFLLSGIFPLVPGAGIYYCAYYFIQGNNALALSHGISTFKVAVALAVGISLVLSVPIPKRHRNKV